MLLIFVCLLLLFFETAEWFSLEILQGFLSAIKNRQKVLYNTQEKK